MTATTDDILALEERRWAAQIGKDEAELMTLLSDELRYTHSTGSVDTKASYMASILENVVDYQTVERTDTEAQLVGASAVVTGRAVIGVEARGRQLELNVAYTVVWLERNGSWQLLTWQSTLLAA
ncbi:MAG: hypothetical protein ACI9TF_000780 [Paracrocinitomix sp.]|jgi:hypothetical protein|tara:strand:+ start:145 stop:519 length:375 start_codon:yes stop_codon:yes gene_type:complete